MQQPDADHYTAAMLPQRHVTAIQNTTAQDVLDLCLQCKEQCSGQGVQLSVVGNLVLGSACFHSPHPCHFCCCCSKCKHGPLMSP
jgi:hypothetical protein